jgi:hypothetical protein
MKITVKANVIITPNPHSVAFKKMTKEEKAELTLAVEEVLNSRTECMVVELGEKKQQVGLRFHFK